MHSSTMGKAMNFGLIFGRILRKLASCNFRYLPGVVCVNAPKTIYLTFDDGPDQHVTSSLLKLLKSHNVKGTFFINGNNFKGNRELLIKLLSDGHLIGNHTMSHCNLSKFENKNFNQEVLCFQKEIESLGTVRRFFRPPRGLLCLRSYVKIIRHKFLIIFWNIDSGDSLDKEKFKIIEDLRGISSGIVLFHDDNSLCIEVLRELIPFWLKKGIKFDVIRERE